MRGCIMALRWRGGPGQRLYDDDDDDLGVKCMFGLLELLSPLTTQTRKIWIPLNYIVINIFLRNF
jgi:hypothetical protein